MTEKKAELSQSDLNAMRVLQQCEMRLSQHKQVISELNFANMQLCSQLDSRQIKEQEYVTLA